MKKTEVSFDTYEDYYITWNNTDIFIFINKAVQEKLPCSEIMTLIDLIYTSEFCFHFIDKIEYKP